MLCSIGSTLSEVTTQADDRITQLMTATDFIPR